MQFTTCSTRTFLDGKMVHCIFPCYHLCHTNCVHIPSRKQLKCNFGELIPLREDSVRSWWLGGGWQLPNRPKASLTIDGLLKQGWSTHVQTILCRRLKMLKAYRSALYNKCTGSLANNEGLPRQWILLGLDLVLDVDVPGWAWGGRYTEVCS